MDDCRALKQMISETKETIQINRRRKILEDLSKSNWSKMKHPHHKQQLLLMKA